MRKIEIMTLFIIFALGSMALVSAEIEFTEQPPDTFAIAIDQSEQVVKYQFETVGEGEYLSDIRINLYAANNIATCDEEGTNAASVVGITEIGSVLTASAITEESDRIQDGNTYSYEVDLIGKLEGKGLFTEFQEIEIWDNTDLAVNAGTDDAYICSQIYLGVLTSDLSESEQSDSIVRIYEMDSQIPENLRLRESTNGTFNSMVPWVIGISGILYVLVVYVPYGKKM